MSALDQHVFFGSFVVVMLPAETKVLIQDSVYSPLGGISLAGVVRGGIGVPVPNRILHRYSLVYVFEGSGWYTDETVTDLPVAPGDVIQISPNSRHGYGPRENLDWHEVYLIFEGPVFDVWAEQNCFDFGGPVHSLKPVDYWRDRFLDAVQPVDRDNRFGSITEVMRVQQLLLDLQLAIRGDDRPHDDAWITQAREALEQAASGQQAAAMLEMSYEAFRKKFRKLYGVPPARYHAGQQMKRACELLAATDLSVQSIAQELDYCDEFHFSKRFSQIIGCSPTTYRARTGHALRQNPPD